MEEIKNIDEIQIKEIVEKFPWVPMFNRVVITLNRDIQEDGLVLNNNPLSEVQYVIAAGPTSQVEPGSKVLLDLNKMTTRVPAKDDSTQYQEVINVDPLNTPFGVFATIHDGQIKMKSK